MVIPFIASVGATAAGVAAGRSAATATGTAIPSLQALAMGGPALVGTGAGGRLNTDLVDLLQLGQATIPQSQRQLLSQDMGSHFDHLSEIIRTRILNVDPASTDIDVMRGRRAAVASIEATRMALQDSMSNAAIEAGVRSDPTRVAPFQELRSEIRGLKTRQYTSDEIFGLFDRFRQLTTTVPGVGTIYGSNYQQNLEFANQVISGGLRRANNELITAQAQNASGRGVLIPMTPHFRLSYDSPVPGSNSRFISPRPLNSRDIARGGLSQLEEENYAAFQRLFTSSGAQQYIHNTSPDTARGSDLYEILTSFRVPDPSDPSRMTEEVRRLRYARYTVGGRSIALPLSVNYRSTANIGENQHLTGLGSHGAEIYHADRAGSQIYAGPGRIITIDNTRVGQTTTLSQGTLNYLFNPYRFSEVEDLDTAGMQNRIVGQIEDIVTRMKNGEDLGSILFTYGDDEDIVANKTKILEAIDPSGNVDLALEKKAAQVMVTATDLENYSKADAQETFELARQAARQEIGTDIYPIAGPGATSKGIFMDPKAPFTIARVGQSETVPLETLNADDPSRQLAEMQEARMERSGVVRSRGRGLAPYHPHFVPGTANPARVPVTKLTSHTPLSRLPGRKLISPFRVINPGSNRAMRILGPMHNWLPFRAGPYRTMMATGIAPAVNGTWFSTPLGAKANADILQEGAVRHLHPYEQESATFAFPGSRARIEMGTVEDPLEVNPKLMGVIRNFEGNAAVMQANSGGAITPEQRRRLVANALQDEDVTFAQGEILGKEVDAHGQVRLSRASGRSDVASARLYLADIIPDERGYNLVFEEEVGIEAAKSEGTVKSTSMRNWSTSQIDAPVMERIRLQIDEVRQRYAQMQGTKPDDELSAEMRTEIDSLRREQQDWMESPQRRQLIMAEHERFMTRISGADVTSLSPAEKSIIDRTSDVITHFSEGKEIFKDGNRRAMLGQQQGALSLLTGQSLEQVVPENVNRSIFINPSQSLLPEFRDLYAASAGPSRYTERDAAMLQELIRRGGELIGQTTSGEERVSLFGKIFGMEQDSSVGILKALKTTLGRSALLKLGYDESMIDDLVKGIEESKFVAGVLERFPRDAAAESRKDANVEKRAIEAAANEMAAGAENNVKYAGAVDAVSNITAQTNKPDPHAMGAWERIAISTEAGKVGNIPESDIVLNLDERSATGQQARLAQINRIQSEGGYLRIHGNDYFIPGESDARRLAMSVSQSGRTTVKTDLFEVIQKVLNNARANISAADDDALDVLVGTLRKELYPLIEQIGREEFIEKPLQGEVRGAKYLLSMGTTPEQLALVGEDATDLSSKVYRRGRSLVSAGAAPSASLAAGERMGFGRQFIEDHFKLLEDYVMGLEQPGHMDAADFKASKEAAVEALKDWKKGVLKRERLFPILEAQPPEISSESNKLVFGVYDPDRNELGGVSSLQVGEWHDKETLESVTIGNNREIDDLPSGQKPSAKRIHIRTDPVTENKSSGDLDGDLKRFIAVIMAQDPNAQNTPGAIIGIVPGADPLEAVRQLEAYHGQLEISGAAAVRRATRRRSRIRGTILEDAINEGLKALAEASGNNIPVDNAGKAFVAQSGQAEIGLVSSAINQVRQILQIAHRKGSLTHAESQLLDNFTTQLEQKSVGFKHLAQSIGQPLSERIKMIMSQQNPRQRAVMIRQFIQQLTNAKMSLPTDMDDRLAQVTAETTTRSVAAATTAATPGDIAAEMSSGEMGTVREALLSASEPETREAYEASVINAQASPQAESSARAGIDNLNLPEDLSAPSGSGAASSARAQANAATVAAGSRAGARRQAATAAEREANAAAARAATRARASNIMQAEARGVAQNSIARIVGVGAAVAIGAYALFNKGYDDTPISDIPPPPSSMFIMGGNGKMPSQGMTGMGSTYNRQARDFSEGSQGGGYIEGNIPAPTAIQSKSYLDGSTARINSRNVTIDRTSATEYARSIRSGLPSSNVGLTINNNYYVPSDIERKL